MIDYLGRRKGRANNVIWYSNDGNSVPVLLCNSKITLKNLGNFFLSSLPGFPLMNQIRRVRFGYGFLSPHPKRWSIANDNKIHKQITEIDWSTAMTLPCAVNDRFDGRLIIFLPHVTGKICFQGVYRRTHNVTKRNNFSWRYEIPDVFNHRNVQRAAICLKIILFLYDVYIHTHAYIYMKKYVKYLKFDQYINKYIFCFNAYLQNLFLPLKH